MLVEFENGVTVRQIHNVGNPYWNLKGKKEVPQDLNHQLIVYKKLTGTAYPLIAIMLMKHVHVLLQSFKNTVSVASSLTYR